MSDKKRIVRVFIVDPDENLDLDDALLHKGDEQFTDLTNQELFFEIDVRGLLEEHNEKRVEVLDKEQSRKFGKDIYLEPARIRDLQMVVVDVAVFYVSWVYKLMAWALLFFIIATLFGGLFLLVRVAY